MWHIVAHQRFNEGSGFPLWRGCKCASLYSLTERPPAGKVTLAGGWASCPEWTLCQKQFILSITFFWKGLPERWGHLEWKQARHWCSQHTTNQICWRLAWVNFSFWSQLILGKVVWICTWEGRCRFGTQPCRGARQQLSLASPLTSVFAAASAPHCSPLQSDYLSALLWWWKICSHPPWHTSAWSAKQRGQVASWSRPFTSTICYQVMWK